MGKYGDEAKKASKYLEVPKGEKIEVVWTGEGVKCKDNFGNVGFEFIFKTDFGDKLYTISKPSEYAKFDDFKAGDTIVLDRSEQKADGKFKFVVYKKGDLTF